MKARWNWEIRWKKLKSRLNLKTIGCLCLKCLNLLLKTHPDQTKMTNVLSQPKSCHRHKKISSVEIVLCLYPLRISKIAASTIPGSNFIDFAKSAQKLQNIYQTP